MEAQNFFVDNDGHARSGWRVLLFVVAFLICAKLFEAFVYLLTGLFLKQPLGNWAFVLGAIILFGSATLVSWGCGAILEDLSFRAVGWWPHRGWLRNLALGSIIGAASLLLAAGLTAITRGIQFSFTSAAAPAVERTLITSALIFIVAGAGEEALFRGYPLQTLTRAQLAWLGILLTSVPFAAAHLYNPHASRTFTFVNTVLAGIWLALAYLRTRSLWFPLGLHWSWNWMQASIFGLPVSGIDKLASAPLLHAMNVGPDWLTGGAYGIEGGAACSIALLISTLVVWQTKFAITSPNKSQN